MHLPQQQKDGFTWNLNTFVSVGGFAVTLVAIAVSYGQFVERSKNVETRVDALEVQVRKIDTMDYRLTAAEAFGVTASRSLEEMRGPSRSIQATFASCGRYCSASKANPRRRCSIW